MHSHHALVSLLSLADLGTNTNDTNTNWHVVATNTLRSQHREKTDFEMSMTRPQIVTKSLFVTAKLTLWKMIIWKCPRHRHYSWPCRDFHNYLHTNPPYLIPMPNLINVFIKSIRDKHGGSLLVPESWT
jgi:hypothetical protein